MAVCSVTVPPWLGWICSGVLTRDGYENHRAHAAAPDAARGRPGLGDLAGHRSAMTNRHVLMHVAASLWEEAQTLEA